jgi:hypothetical protein
VGFGLHTDLDAPDVQLGLQALLESINATADSQRDTLPRPMHVLWAARSSSRSMLKPRQYQQSQDNSHTLGFNAALASFCKQHGLPVFDWFALSLDAHSPDGTHYTRATYVTLAQSLLNYYAQRIA